MEYVTYVVVIEQLYIICVFIVIKCNIYGGYIPMIKKVFPFSSASTQC